ncbi:ParA family protein [Faecalispora sporosphaeroides]|uniref:ParA family protein n=1 Tax=Faecalispora sporosphaeroides TaxID=1549 RepID=UPI000360486A|nr:AAA family ATPase [Faecalispora sporosphaeroides]
MQDNRLIAIWGSVASGKTTLTIKIAKELAALKKNVLVIYCDNETPMLPLLLPVEERVSTLGDVLSLPEPTVNDLLKHCHVYGGSGYLSILGYKLGDNLITYHEYLDPEIRFFYRLCRQIPDIDYILVDCSHHTSEILTATALEIADQVLQVSTATLKSAVYNESQKRLLQGARYHYKQHLQILNDVFPKQDTYSFREALGGADYIFPHCPAITQQTEEKKLLDAVYGKEGKVFQSAMNDLIKEAFQK